MKSTRWIAGCLLLLLCVPCFGQSVAPVSLERATQKTVAEQRAQMYQDLRRRAEVLEAQAEVTKLTAKLTRPAVVNVEPRTNQTTQIPSGVAKRFGESGAGVVIEWKSKYYVLSNQHLVQGLKPEEIRLTLLDGRQLTPVHVWVDAATDVAVLAVQGDDLTAAPLGNSDIIDVGDPVLAVGSPFGLSHTVTNGIISARGRHNINLGQWGVHYEDFLQTDAPINPGNSGGPLLNLRGEVIAINTAFITNSGGSQGVGFAIPINMFMRVATQLIEHGRFPRTKLGVDAADAKAVKADDSSNTALPFNGVLVKHVDPSSAVSASLQPGDVILQYDGTPVENESHLTNLVGLTATGASVTMQILHDHRVVQTRFILAEKDNLTLTASR